MKKPARIALFVVVALFALIALAGPRPYATLTVDGAGVTPICLTASQGAAFVAQCPNQAAWFRTVTAAELACPSCLTDPAAGMTDGGAFGVLFDFRTQSDPVGILLGVNQTGVCLLGIDAGGTYPCYFNTP